MEDGYFIFSGLKKKRWPLFISTQTRIFPAKPIEAHPVRIASANVPMWKSMQTVLASETNEKNAWSRGGRGKKKLSQADEKKWIIENADAHTVEKMMQQQIKRTHNKKNRRMIMSVVI